MVKTVRAFSMKKLSFLVSTAFVGSMIVAMPANAFIDLQSPGFSAVLPDPFLLRFNENGIATISVNGGPATSLVGTLQPDPTMPPGPGTMVALT